MEGDLGELQKFLLRFEAGERCGVVQAGKGAD